jgi:glycosyltransferase involved in cell wall biosynthesis
MRPLQVNLDSPLPAAISIGGGTALFVGGTCFDERRRITGLALVLDGAPQPVMAYGMPRLDYFRVLHPSIDPYQSGELQSDTSSPEDPQLHSYRSGFWGLVRIGTAPPSGELELSLRASFDSGEEEAVPLGRIAVAELPEPVRVDPPDGPGPLVAICLATYNPPLELFRRQVESIRAQTHAHWVCLISDDGSAPEHYESLQHVVGDDPRFLISRSPRRLGFYLNFERALAMAPRDAPFIALSDQDDEWYPTKLQVLLSAIGDRQLVYSDARIVDEQGELIASTYWGVRRNNHEDLLSLLMANSVTGAASLFRRRVADHALPFPPAQFAHFHDHWIALVALALGGIGFVPDPLYDYVQHGHAALGHAQANQIFTLRQRLERLRVDPRERVRAYRSRYFVDLMRLMAFASILQMRCGSEMAPPVRRELTRFLALEDSWPALGRLGVKAGRELVGRPETLGAELALFQSLIWRRLLSMSVTDRPGRRLRLDSVPPPDLAPRPGRREAPDAEGARVLWEKLAPLELSVSDDAPRRLNVLIPTFDLKHFFGGYIAKLNLARALTRRGERVRLVTVDPVGPLPGSWRSRVESYSGLAGLFDDVEVVFGREAAPVEVSRSDGFIASTWWTAHIAQAALSDVNRAGFLYLIQEYEPMTFPMGSYAALAAQSYRFPHFGLFSSRLLHDYFDRHEIGVYEPGGAGAGQAAVFENAITPVVAPDASELAARSSHRLLFYARPEPHAARNMFELGLLALQQAVAEGVFRDGWELRGIGSVGNRRRVRLGGGAELELLPRSGQDDYARVLREHDLGLALMYTPHPSLVPIEMACAGLLTVTNTFENKTAEALRAISTNLIAGEPSVDGIVGALREAAAGVDDAHRRLQGSAVDWSRSWEESFNAELLERVRGYLAR